MGSEMCIRDSLYGGESKLVLLRPSLILNNRGAESESESESESPGVVANGPESESESESEILPRLRLRNVKIL